MDSSAKTSPITAFFSQSQTGVSSWWSWLVVIWFALIIWMYGQVVFGIPMMIAAMVSDPEILDSLEALSADQAGGALENLSSLAVFASPIIAILLWKFRDGFSAKARKTVLIIAASQVILSFCAFIYLVTASNQQVDASFITQILGSNPVSYMFMLLTFPPLALGLWLGQKHIHKRSILSLHTAHAYFRWKRLGFSMLVFWLIAAGLTYLGHVSGKSGVELVFDPDVFWTFLLVTLLFIPLQSATEEIALRGYLNQSLGHYIKNPWIVFFITSAGFAALHLGNPEIAARSGDTPLLIAISGYFFFGFFACILTWIDGGLETAIGVHAANNIFAASIVGYESSALPIPTVFKVPLNTSYDSMMVVVSLSLICFIMYITRKPLISQKS